MLEISSFFVFQGNSFFEMIEQALLNRAFLARYGEPSWAELFSPKARAKTGPSRALARTQHYPQVFWWFIKKVVNIVVNLRIQFLFKSRQKELKLPNKIVTLIDLSQHNIKEYDLFTTEKLKFVKNMKFENTAGFICGLFVALIMLNNEIMEKRVSKY